MIAKNDLNNSKSLITRVTINVAINCNDSPDYIKYSLF